MGSGTYFPEIEVVDQRIDITKTSSKHHLDIIETSPYIYCVYIVYIVHQVLYLLYAHQTNYKTSVMDMYIFSFGLVYKR